MNIKTIETSNAVRAFLPRSLAPVAVGYQGSALPIGGAALEPVALRASNAHVDRSARTASGLS